MKNSTLVVIQSSPYQNNQAQDGLDFVMAAVAFDLPVRILFENKGIYNLINKQNTSLLNKDAFIEFLKAAELYEIAPIYIRKNDFLKYNVNSLELILENNLIEFVEEENIKNIYNQYEHILTY